MTAKIKTDHGRMIGRIKTLLIAGVMFLPIIYSEALRRGFTEGLKTAVLSVLPAVFPYTVLVALISTGEVKDGVLARAFTRWFNLPKECLPCFLLGSVFGFPLGVTLAEKLYRGGMPREYTEKAAALSSTTSLSFALSAVGVGLYRSVKIGALIFLSTLIARLINALIFRGKPINFSISKINSGQRSDFVSAIKNAGSVSVTISSFIIFFSLIVSLVSEATKSAPATVLFAAFSEASTAARLISRYGENEVLKLSLTSFALGFSGLSLHLQATALLPEGVIGRRYFLMKLSEGVLSGMICAVIYSLTAL